MKKNCQGVQTNKKQNTCKQLKKYEGKEREVKK